ncbi:MAG TPA: hypothetical protein VJ984_10605 [Xanthomonadales bacterium]|nr:hypothetical protein [Xanthomonadales bacterium]
MANFFKEIKRRKVWQAALIYVAVAWVLIQVADTVMPMFDAPKWVVTAFTILLGLGFPIAIVLAWAYELKPHDSESSETDSSTTTGTDNLPVTKSENKEQPQLQTGQADSSRTSKSWIAVMPFKVPADHPELSELGDGLTENICAGLARFPYLAVIARESVSRKAAEIKDVREFSETLGARYVIEGSVRGSGDNVRISLRLIEAAPGISLWGDHFTRDISETDLFALEDEISDHVVATLADSFGVLIRSLTESIEDLPETELSPIDWLLRTFEYLRLYLPDQHALLRDQLEGAVERYPRSPEIRASLAHVYLNEANFGFNPKPDSLDRALKQAEQAFELDGASQFVNQQLAQVHFFRRDLDRFRRSADRAIALNPLDTNTLGIIGLLFVHIREFDRGIEITQKVMQLNENHAHWCHFSWIWYHCGREEYEQALERVSMVNIAGNFWIPLVTAAIHVQLNREQDAQAAVARLLGIDPDFASHGRSEIEAWHFASGFDEFLIDGLNRAGLRLQ